METVSVTIFFIRGDIMVKKRNGAALVIAVIVMMVFMMLGTTLLNVSSFEANTIVSQNKKLQAYYLARAGAESTLKAWKDAPSLSKARPIGLTHTYYLQSDGSYSTTTSTLGSFQINVTKVGTVTTIISTGTFSNVSQKSTLTINQVNNYLMGDSVGWYDFNSGQVNPGNHDHQKGPIVIKPKGTLKYPNKNNYTTTYDADIIYFDCNLGNPDHNKITLVAKIIVTYGTLDIFGNGNSSTYADLFVKVPTVGGISIGNGTTYIDGDGATLNVTGKKYGILYIKVSTGVTERYYYPEESDGISLKTEKSKLVKMNTSDPNYEIPDYTNNYTFIWS